MTANNDLPLPAGPLTPEQRRALAKIRTDFPKTLFRSDETVALARAILCIVDCMLPDEPGADRAK
jgi:hypothetical protein